MTANMYRKQNATEYISFVSGQKVLAIAEAFVNKCPKIYKETD